MPMADFIRPSSPSPACRAAAAVSNVDASQSFSPWVSMASSLALLALGQLPPPPAAACAMLSFAWRLVEFFFLASPCRFTLAWLFAGPGRTLHTHTSSLAMGLPALTGEPAEPAVTPTTHPCHLRGHPPLIDAGNPNRPPLIQCPPRASPPAPPHIGRRRRRRLGWGRDLGGAARHGSAWRCSAWVRAGQGRDLGDAEVERVVPALRVHLRRQQPVRLPPAIYNYIYNSIYRCVYISADSSRYACRPNRHLPRPSPQLRRLPCASMRPRCHLAAGGCGASSVWRRATA
jgi:hypothetical protein